jgi:hypothetical protein
VPNGEKRTLHATGIELRLLIKTDESRNILQLGQHRSLRPPFSIRRSTSSSKQTKPNRVEQKLECSSNGNASSLTVGIVCHISLMGRNTPLPTLHQIFKVVQWLVMTTNQFILIGMNDTTRHVRKRHLSFGVAPREASGAEGFSSVIHVPSGRAGCDTPSRPGILSWYGWFPSFLSPGCDLI